MEQLRLKQRMLNLKRRQTLNKIFVIKGSIKVFCRIPPFVLAEKRRISEPVSGKSETVRVQYGGTRKDFEFDKVFTEAASQESVFAEVEPILRSAMDGHNVCVFAYGQTGTGKTFTMDGTNEHPGIIPRAIEQLFHQACTDNSSYTFSMSMLEVYMGNLRDLLAPRKNCRAYEPMKKCNLNIQTDPKGLIEIEGLTEVQVSDNTIAKWWYKKGRRFRSTSWTNVNEASSRSHCLTRINIFRLGEASEAKSRISQLWMVDLGGSERLLKTGAIGLTLDEGRAINLSLSALADVIAALKRRRCHVPYRNSKLTQILKDSLGDGSKVLMVVHIRPCEEDVCETISSLKFGKRTRAIVSKKEVSMELKNQRDKKITELEEEIKEIEKQLENIRDDIKNAELNLNKFNIVTQNDEVETFISVKKKYMKSNVSNSGPRFMNPTVSSLQRKNAVERESIVLRSKTLRPFVTKKGLMH